MRLWIDRAPVARIVRSGTGGIALTYEESWLRAPDSFPLSASLPLQEETLRSAKVERWFINLLPENPAFLEHLAFRYGVRDVNDTFALIGKIGMDLPGAIAVLPDGEQPDVRTVLEELSEGDIAEELEALRQLTASPQQRLSLAGAQPKTAYYLGVDGRWYRPSYAAASTHILKPAMPRNDGLDWVELAMQMTAARVGINAALSQVKSFGGTDAFVSTRFDRHLRHDGTVERIHTEDLLQTLGVPVFRKYQKSAGGPGVRELVGAVRRLDPGSEEEVWARLAFNVVSGNADAHGKNYSFFVGSQGHRLAPAYDLISLRPFPQYVQELAMSIGRQWNYERVTDDDWRYAAKKAGSDPSVVMRVVDRVREVYPAALRETLSEINRDIPQFEALLPA